MLNLEQYREIYTILDRALPVPYDCGSLCGSICCSDIPFDKGESYIYLFPGEKEYLESVGSNIRIYRQKRKNHDLPASWGKYVYIAKCPGTDKCDRPTRPIQCRTFPLQPYISDTGTLEMVLSYMDLPYSCPLVEKKVQITDDFKHLVLDAWKILIEDTAIRDLVILDSEEKRGASAIS